MDTACTSKSAPKKLTGGDLPSSFTSTTGVMLVELDYFTQEAQRGTGFSATYATSFTHLRLDPHSWHHFAASVTRGGVLSVHINGIQEFSDQLNYYPAKDPPFAGEFGTSIGRGAPGWQNGGDFGHYIGILDSLRIWSVVRTTAQISALISAGCPPDANCFSCYSFDLHTADAIYFVDDSGHERHLRSASGSSPHLPWCVNMDDNSQDEVANNCEKRAEEGEEICTGYMSNRIQGSMWGFCDANNKPRLPGAGMDYNTVAMEAALGHVMERTQHILSKYPGCGLFTFSLIGNKALEHGGGIYYDSCTSMSTRCFVEGMSLLSSSKTVWFQDNLAQAGGAIFVKCIHLGMCEQTFSSANVIGSLPLLPKAGFEANKGQLYGGNIATIAATVKFGKGNDVFNIELIPGQQTLSVAFLLYDALDTLVIGSSDLVETLICQVSEYDCGTSTTMVPPQYQGFDAVTGLGALSVLLNVPLAVQKRCFTFQFLEHQPFQKFLAVFIADHVSQDRFIQKITILERGTACHVDLAHTHLIPRRQSPLRQTPPASTVLQEVNVHMAEILCCLQQEAGLSRAACLY